MNLTKEQVCVKIKNHPQLKEAVELVNKNGYDVDLLSILQFSEHSIIDQFLIYDDTDCEWFIGSNQEAYKQITLEELDAILKAKHPKQEQDDNKIKAYAALSATSLLKANDFPFAYKNKVDKIVRCNLVGFSPNGYHVINERGALVIVKHQNLLKPGKGDWERVTYISIEQLAAELILHKLLK